MSNVRVRLELAAATGLLAEALAVDLDPGRALPAVLGAAGGERWRQVGDALVLRLAQGEWLPTAMAQVAVPWPAGWRQLQALLERQAHLGVRVAAALRSQAELWHAEAWQEWQGRARWAGLVGRLILGLCFLPGIVLAGFWPLLDLVSW
jgi:hypothetical protein